MTDHIERTKRMIEVMQAYVDGERVEFGEPWWPVTDMHSWSSNYTYRIAKTPDTINWDHVAPEFKYMARDEDGYATLFTKEPEYREKGWYMKYETGHKVCTIEAHSSYHRGACDWKDSLVIRPGFE